MSSLFKSRLHQVQKAELLRAEADAALVKRHKLSLQEYGRILEILGRSPSLTELGVFSAMWSEHCSYKSSRVHLRKFWTDNENVVVGPGENAGVVRLSDKLCLAFKMESHNHPSYLEPYQGAATGVGGILRDVFCMGARPVANLNCLRFGVKSHPRTPYLLQEAVRGIGDYGNCIGVPTVGGSLEFDSTYDGNCLVNAMTVGVIHEDKIFKGYASGIGNLVIYVGSSTGRDGVHGATMASDSFSSGNSAAEERSAVQVGDPFMEKLLLEATLEVIDRKLIVGLQDMGAAGLTSSSFEMASRAGNGIEIDLDQIPVRTENLTAYELMLSESQERMLMVAEPAHWKSLEEVFKRWGLAYAIIGKVTDSERVQIYYKNKLEVDMPVSEATDQAPVLERPVRAHPERPKHFSPPQEELFYQNLNRTLEDSLWGKNSNDKKSLLTLFIEHLNVARSDLPTVLGQYDRHIGDRTVLSGYHGGAAVLWLHDGDRFGADMKQNPYLGFSVHAGCLQNSVAADSRLGAERTVLKLFQSLTAVGSTPLALTDCLNFGSPENVDVMTSFAQSVIGITAACKQLNTPVVSGNVSLYNDTDGDPIKPTPMLGMVGRVDDVRKVRPAVLSYLADCDRLYWLRPKRFKRDEMQWAGTLLSTWLTSSDSNNSANISTEWFQNNAGIHWEQEKKLASILHQMMQGDGLTPTGANRLCVAAKEVGTGGVLMTAAKMMFTPAQNPAERRAMSLQFKPATHIPFYEYFGEFGSGYCLQLTRSGVDRLNEILRHEMFNDVALVYLGDLKINLSVPQESATDFPVHLKSIEPKAN